MSKISTNLLAALHFVIGAGTPIVTALVSNPNAPMTSRALWAMGIGGLIGGAAGLISYFSTTYAQSPSGGNMVPSLK